MNGRTSSMVLVGVGVLLVVISLSADTLGIGEGTGIGYKQIIGTIVGLGLAVAGVLAGRRG